MDSIARKGYTKKPRWIYLLGFFFILAPFGNFLWSLAAIGVTRWWDPHVWKIWLPYVEWYAWILMGLVTVSGFSLLLVRKWSWIFSISSLTFVLLYSLALLPDISSKASIAIVALLMLMTVGAIALICFSPFRLPYIHSRLRWWETSPRYKVDIYVKVEDLERDVRLVDISRTGAMVESISLSAELALYQRTKLAMPMGLVLPAEVARITTGGYGFRFLKGPDKRATQTLKAFLKQLAKDPTKLVRG